MHDNIVTHDLADFGMRELGLAGELLAALAKDRPAELGDGVRVWLNRKSGFVFLCDEDFVIFMLRDGKLEQFHSCPECGQEGFADDLSEHGNDCCREYLGETEAA